MLVKCPNCDEHIEIPVEKQGDYPICPECNYVFFDMEYLKCNNCKKYILFYYIDNHNCNSIINKFKED